MSETSMAAGTAELKAALNALQTSLENLDAELYPDVPAWSDEARASRDVALRDWADAARHMQTIIDSLEQQ